VQNFSVMFDLYSSDITVMDVNATYNLDDCPVYDTYSNWIGSTSSDCSIEVEEVANKNKYNSSASSTYAGTKGNTGRFLGRGEYDRGTAVSDIVNIGGLLNNMTFGAMAKVGEDIADYPIDGTLGLNPANSFNQKSGSSDRFPSVLQQIVGSMAQPVVTMHMNRTYGTWDSDVEILFGSKSLTQCNQSNWKTISLVKPANYANTHRFAAFSAANLTSISIASPGVAGDCDNAVIATHDLRVVNDVWSGIVVSVQALNVFKKASGATCKPSPATGQCHYYTMDCSQVDNALNVNLGLADGNTIVLTPRDYILYEPWLHTCILNVRGFYDDGLDSNSRYSIPLGQLWLNRHCVSYDINANTLSYTDALPNNGN